MYCNAGFPFTINAKTERLDTRMFAEVLMQSRAQSACSLAVDNTHFTQLHDNGVVNHAVNFQNALFNRAASHIDLGLHLFGVDAAGCHTLLRTLLSVQSNLAFLHQPQIAQLDATIRSQEESVRLGFSRIENDEVQSRRSVDAQRASVTAAQATFTRQSLEYDRAVQLRGESVISQSEMDAAQAAYDTARANLAAAEEGLARLLSGAADTGNTDAMALPTIEQARSETRNRENDVEALRQQKKGKRRFYELSVYRNLCRIRHRNGKGLNSTLSPEKTAIG